MAPHSSTLAWKTPWMEEPGGLQSMMSQRVRHNWATSFPLFTSMHWRRKWQPTPVFLPGESQGWWSLVGCHLWSHTVGHDWSDLAAPADLQLCSMVSPEKTQDVVTQDTSPRQLSCKSKEWFQWAQTLAYSYAYICAKFFTLRYVVFN